MWPNDLATNPMPETVILIDSVFDGVTRSNLITIFDELDIVNHLAGVDQTLLMYGVLNVIYEYKTASNELCRDILVYTLYPVVNVTNHPNAAHPLQKSLAVHRGGKIAPVA